MSTSQQLGLPAREPQMGQTSNVNSLDEHMKRALNKIRKPNTAEEITGVLNRDLDPGDPPFQAREVSTWLQNAGDIVLHWIGLRAVLAGSHPRPSLPDSFVRPG